jgi:small subunit ribosomal protein S4
MSSLHGPKAKTQRRFGEVLIPRAKYAKILEKRAYPPGDHGKEKAFRSGRRSNYGMQLDEKQKLSFIYNIRERQMRNYFKRATRLNGPTGAILLGLLERRLDNLVYKSGLAATIWAARQLVVHGHINLNGRKLDLPSYEVAAGDVISLTDRMKRNVHVTEWVDQTSAFPSYLSVDKAARSVTLTRIPEATEIQVPVNVQLIVEFYNRVT